MGSLEAVGKPSELYFAGKKTLSGFGGRGVESTARRKPTTRVLEFPHTPYPTITDIMCIYIYIYVTLYVYMCVWVGGRVGGWVGGVSFEASLFRFHCGVQAPFLMAEILHHLKTLKT